MSTAVAEAAAQLRPNFVRGQKKLYLPNHVVTFIRPKPKQSPNLATFVVPLHFNKLDLRDYLFHAYSVKALSVRSFINSRAPERKSSEMRGQIYRPRSQKMMIVELEKPFVWPEPLKGQVLEAFDHEAYKAMDDAREKSMQDRVNRQRGYIPSRSSQPVSRERKDLALQAQALLTGAEKWENRTHLDDRWKEIVKEATKR